MARDRALLCGDLRHPRRPVRAADAAARAPSTHPTPPPSSLFCRLHALVVHSSAVKHTHACDELACRAPLNAAPLALFSSLRIVLLRGERTAASGSRLLTRTKQPARECGAGTREVELAVDMREMTVGEMRERSLFEMREDAEREAAVERGAGSKEETRTEHAGGARGARRHQRSPESDVSL